MVNNHHNAIKGIFLNALLKISENDPQTARDLLTEQGIDPDALTAKTLKNIKRYQSSLAHKTTENDHNALLALIEEKLNRLLVTMPAKTRDILQFYLQDKTPAFSFKRTGHLKNMSALANASSQDLLQLLEKLNEIDQ